MRFHYEPPAVYFMHLPKTGGTAIGHWLQTVYRVRDYIDVDIPAVIHVPSDRLTSFRCYHSWHHGRQMLEFIGRRDVDVFTMLRHPIERSVSAYDQHKRHLARHPELFSLEYTASMAELLDNDIEDCRDLDRIVITQTSYLGNRRDYRRFFEECNAKRADGQDLVLRAPYAIHDVAGTRSPDRLLERAIAWLHEMPVVGLTERFDESMLLIADLLGVPAPAVPPQANVNPNRRDARQSYRDALKPSTLARLEQLNQQDFELYAVAQDLFEQQWARFQKRRSRAISVAPRLRSTKRRIVHICSRLKADPAGRQQ
jgi:hypothetical protein